MLSNAQDVVIVIAIVAVSLLFMTFTYRLWPAQSRREQNDVIGWQLSILGTAYAVILGFMLYAVWSDFGVADLNANSEANSLLNVYHLARGLPDQQQEELRETARVYADVVVQQDWPLMASGSHAALKSRDIDRQMWRILMSVKSANPEQLTAEDHALYELSALGEQRQLRQSQSNSKLPSVLWFVLIIGGIVTIVSSCMFGSSNQKLHAFQVFAFSLLLALALIAIADIDRPFQGTVHVSDAQFVRAQNSMKGK